MKAKNHLGNHAIVIGGSIAGMLSGRILRDYFTQVTIIDRDRLPLEAQSRKGVPQSLQPHVLLTRGYRIIQELFPDITAELTRQGALNIDWGKEFRCFGEAGWFANSEEDSGIASVTCSRPLLETTIRQQLQQKTNVKFLAEQRVTGLIFDSQQQRVMGVKTNSGHQSTETPIIADLVVDCSGRNSQAPQWLEDIGITPPVATKINANLGYATRRYKPLENSDCWKVLLINQIPPDVTRLGYLAKIENGELIATLGGYKQDFPPLDDEGWLNFARHLRHPGFYEAIKDAEPISPIYAYRATANRLRHYEKMQLPTGFIALGDAVCALCPVYGQGMTVSALAALVLQQWLAKANRAWFNKQLSPVSFQKALAKSNAFHWNFATAQDSRFLETEQKDIQLGEQFFQQYLNKLQTQATINPQVYISFLQIAHSLKSPLSFFDPKLIWQVYFSKSESN